MFNYVAIYFIYIKKTIVVTFCNNRSLHASSLRNVAGTKNCRLWEIYDLIWSWWTDVLLSLGEHVQSKNAM